MVLSCCPVGSADTAAKVYDVEDAAHQQKEMEEEQQTAVQASQEGFSISLDPEIFRLISYASFWTMMGMSIAITKGTVDVPDPNPLELTFGYSNICLYFDYDPPRIFAAMFYPLVEYSMVAYIILNWMSARNVFDLTKASERNIFIVFSIASLIEVILVAWFRMVFVIRAFDDLTGHTVPFMGLQVTLCMISVQNCIFYYYLHRGIDYSDLDKYGRKAWLGIVAYSYTGLLVAVTLGKFILTGSVLNGHPVMTIGTPKQKAVGTFFDTAWVFLAAIFPLFISAYLVTKKGKPKAKIILN